MIDRLGKFVESALMGSRLRRREMFDYDFVKRLLVEQRSGKDNHSFFLWSLLNLSLWYDHWIEGDRTAHAENSPVEMNAGHGVSP